MAVAEKTRGLSEEEMCALDRCMQMSMENKINKDNAFQMDFIDRMPDLVAAMGAEDSGAASQSATVTFQSASVMLDTGVNIYGKRVEALHDVAFSNLMGVRRKGDGPGGEDEAGEEGGDGDRPGEPAAAAGGRKRRRGGGEPGDTLSTAEDLRKKPTKVTFDADPLFARTSKLFDENSVTGLLLLNTPVYERCDVMFDSHEVPMQKFVVPLLDDPSSPAADADVALSRLFDFCTAGGGGLSAAVAEVLRAADKPGAVPLMPSLPELYALLEGGTKVLEDAYGEGAALAEKMLREERAARQQRQGARRHPSGAAQAFGNLGGAAGDGAHPSAGGPGAGAAGQPCGGGPFDRRGSGGGADDDDGSWRDAASGDHPDNNHSSGGGGLPDQMGRMNLEDDWQDEGDDGRDGGGGDGGGAYGDWGGEDDGGGSDGGGEAGGTHGYSHGNTAQDASGVLDADLLTWMDGGGTGEYGRGVKNWRRVPSYMMRATGKAPTKRRQRPAIEAIDFEADVSPADIEVTLATEKELCLKTAKQQDTLMTEDALLWKGETVERLMLIPKVSITSVWRRRHAAEAAEAAAAARQRQQQQQDSDVGAGCASGVYGDDHDGGGGGYDDDDGGDGGYGGGGGAYNCGEDGLRDFTARTAVEDENDPLGLGLLLLPPPRAVKRIDVNYARTAKHVDVKALKDALDGCLKGLQATSSRQQADISGGRGAAASSGALDFKQMVRDLPADGAVGPLSEVSVHLCFICLLHLANEQGLALTNTGRLDTLHVATASPTV